MAAIEFDMFTLLAKAPGIGLPLTGPSRLLGSAGVTSKPPPSARCGLRRSVRRRSPTSSRPVSEAIQRFWITRTESESILPASYRLRVSLRAPRGSSTPPPPATRYASRSRKNRSLARRRARTRKSGVGPDEGAGHEDAHDRRPQQPQTLIASARGWFRARAIPPGGIAGTTRTATAATITTNSMTNAEISRPLADRPYQAVY
jgi:hypothetical protein